MPKGKQPSKIRTSSTKSVKLKKRKSIKLKSGTGISTALYGGQSIPKRSVFTIGERK